jgi:ribonuclease J
MSGDFKFDQTPIDGHTVDVSRLARIGEEGVHVLFCDSTNAEKSGFTPSESLVGESFDRIFSATTGRLIIAAFASNIHRVQQVFNIAHKYGRRVAVVGRSMAENSRIAEELGYLKVPEGARLRLDELDNVDPSEVVIMTTGSQGEPLSALSKMAMEEHKKIKLGEGDTVIISATPIPGNEDLVMRTVNRLFKQGVEVIYEAHERVHVSGHGSQEDIKLMLNLLKPKYVVPVHGEQRHYARFVTLSESIGYVRENIFRMYPGDVLETDGEVAAVAGKVPAGCVMVDGLGVGDVEDVVLRDRWHLAQDGIVMAVIGLDMSTKQVVSGPDVFSRGFVGEDYREELVEEEKQIILKKIGEFIESDSFEALDEIKAAIRKGLAKFIYERTHRRPMIVPIVMEV